MVRFASLLVLCSAAALLGQTPPPRPAAPAAPATPVPAPTITLSAENPAPPPSVPPDRVVITVDGVKVTAGELDQIIDTLNEQYRPIARGLGRKQFADNVVRIMVLAAEGKRRKLDQTESFKAQTNFANQSILGSLAYADISKGVKVEEADLKKYYDAHKTDFEEVRARHILIRMQGSAVPVKPGQKDLTEAEALAKAQEIRKQIAGGADFAALATKESDDTASGAKGGDLGFFHHGQMVPSFEQVAFQLKPGELSEPVKSQFGYHILRVDEVKGFADVRAEVERKMLPERMQKEAEDLQSKAKVTLDPEFFGTAKK
jgi:peptidyl-prolyl cis-trans isomerase C